jgi:hypothetical protein
MNILPVLAAVERKLVCIVSNLWFSQSELSINVQLMYGVGSDSTFFGYSLCLYLSMLGPLV